MCVRVGNGGPGGRGKGEEEPTKRCAAFKDKTICLLLLVTETIFSLRVGGVGCWLCIRRERVSADEG